MRAIFINPRLSIVTEINTDWRDKSQLTDLIENPVLGHIAFQTGLPEHDAFVDVYGAQKRLKVWHFANTLIWGPALIVRRTSDGLLSAATVSLDLVRQCVRWA